MNRAWTAGLLLAALAATPARAADTPGLEALALCQASWLDWKSTDPAKLQSFAAWFRSAFTPHGDDGAFAPKSPVTVAGLKVTQVYPDSVGMGVGFSTIVDAPFAVAKQAVEQTLGKPLAHCEDSDGMKGCDLQLAEQRTVTLMAADAPDDKTTLVGCYFFMRSRGGLRRIEKALLSCHNAIIIRPARTNDSF